ncbi:ANTAR domain-containing response regulator [Clostridium sp. Marseille-P3244]|uniref:ANTAR domain-containing response regulator n=1 Tax=Clostridium sp. Marseille-P3244 TaxID=1871020 RepID=UPI00093017E3|nr:ANTAR domain-containing protein [Clostridium sp. Marseille-P3244]
MINIIVAFSKRENAVNIRNILAKSGFQVSAVCQTGSQVLQYAGMWEEGIVICGVRLQDMHYTQLRGLLAAGFEMLLAGSPAKWMDDGLPDGVIGLPAPIKVYDLVNTVEMLYENKRRRHTAKRQIRHQRNEGERREIERAKALLMERNHMTEEEAHRYLQKTSMESGTNMTETAQMVLTVMGD